MECYRHEHKENAREIKAIEAEKGGHYNVSRDMRVHGIIHIPRQDQHERDDPPEGEGTGGRGGLIITTGDGRLRDRNRNRV